MELVRVKEANPGDRGRRAAVRSATSRLVCQYRAAALWLAATLVLSIVLVVAWRHPTINLLAAGCVVSAIVGWQLGAQVALRKAAVTKPHRASGIQPSPARRPSDPDSPARELLLKSALENLADVEALGRSPLTRLAALSSSNNAGIDLRDMLVAVLTELTASRAPRDREAGQLLFDYYVKRVGSHEVVMERLCLSRPTFYRRLHRGFERLAERVEAVNEFATRSEEAIA
jgi:hypothetical protein